MLPNPPLQHVVAAMPHIRYQSRTDGAGQLWLHFSCNACGDHTRKPCGDSRRATHWLQTYAGLHQHRAPAHPAPGGRLVQRR